jgi:hypothetical protein
MAYQWAQMADVASKRLFSGDAESGFYRAKLATARFYFKRLLPRARAHAEAALAGADSVMALEEADFGV